MPPTCRSAAFALLFAPLFASLFALGACSVTSEYTAAEAPKNLTLDTVTSRVDLRFAAGSARLLPADAARLRAIAAAGAIGPADRVTVAAAGGPALARARAGAVAAVLLPYGIVAAARPPAPVPPDRAIVETARTLVTLPPCPNWSKPPASDFTNSPSSNFGCATAINLGLMVANPGDLASGRPLGPAAGQPAVAAVTRYLTDKIELPAAGGATPFTSAASSASSTPSTSGGQ